MARGATLLDGTPLLNGTMLLRCAPHVAPCGGMPRRAKTIRG